MYLNKNIVKKYFFLMKSQEWIWWFFLYLKYYKLFSVLQFVNFGGVYIRNIIFRMNISIIYFYFKCYVFISLEFVK